MSQEGIALFLMLFIGGFLFLRNSSKPRFSKEIPTSSNKQQLSVEAEDIPVQESLKEIPTSSNEQPSSVEAEDVELREPLKYKGITRLVGKHKFQLRSFRIPKDGFSEEECEDNSAITSDDSAILRVAVSDGATEGIFSNIWSKLLVNGYTENGSQIFEPSKLQLVHNEFVQKAFITIANMPETRHWFMYEKLERGTHATIAAVEFSGSETVHLSTVGDSCVFWQDGNEIGMLPELSSEDFGSFPNTICHVPKTWKNLEQKIIKKEIPIYNPFQIAICTDALACWLVRDIREKNEPSTWKNIFQISDFNSFNEFIQELRARKAIRNDDVTLVLIDVLPYHV